MGRLLKPIFRGTLEGEIDSVGKEVQALGCFEFKRKNVRLLRVLNTDWSLGK